jgi:hypothetical protein
VPVADTLAEGFARGFADAVSPDQRRQHAFHRRSFGGFAHRLAAAVLFQPDRFLDQVAGNLFDIAADIADLGELGRLDLEERAPASFARRRLISVLPQPVGPIIRMFLGVTSSRSSAGSRWRRQRLRSATATARLASAWPMICSSSAATIALGVRFWLHLSGVPAGSAGAVHAFDGQLVVGVNADFGGDFHRAARDRFGVGFVIHQRAAADSA